MGNIKDYLEENFEEALNEIYEERERKEEQIQENLRAAKIALESIKAATSQMKTMFGSIFDANIDYIYKISDTALKIIAENEYLLRETELKLLEEETNGNK